MRLKIISILIFAGLVASVGMFYLKGLLASPTPHFSASPPPPPPKIVATAVSSGPSRPATALRVLSPENRQAMIEAEKGRLSAWSMKSDAASRSNILGDLVSPEKEIRAAAIEAIIQFGDPGVVPVLKGIAANTDDTSEQIALLNAVDFLSIAPLETHPSHTAPDPANGGQPTVTLTDPRQGIKARQSTTTDPVSAP